MAQTSTNVGIKELLNNRTVLVFFALALFVIVGGLIMPQSLGTRSL